MNQDEALDTVSKKIDREKILLNGARAMLQSTNNPAVMSRLNNQIRDGQRNIEYLEGRLRELQVRKMGSDMDSVHLDSNGGPPPPAHGSQQGIGRAAMSSQDGGRGYPGDGSSYGEPGSGGYSQLSGGHGLMPPRAPYAPPGPGSGGPKPKPNYSRLGA